MNNQIQAAMQEGQAIMAAGKARANAQFARIATEVTSEAQADAAAQAAMANRTAAANMASVAALQAEVQAMAQQKGPKPPQPKKP